MSCLAISGPSPVCFRVVKRTPGGSTMRISTAALATLAALSFAGVAQARDQVKIAGSSTVLPFANVVAEQFGKANPKFKTPVVESGGSSAGLKNFCSGVGENTIDIANSSRPI